ncbi:cytotoxic T-lymphocyte protein 4 [Grus japonensis]|uniref:Cytotoxic T-lymphocyte protein 4 n=3 Tax=Neoaves TaxID=3078114 RepID=A0ABC9X361_GRUJA
MSKDRGHHSKVVSIHWKEDTLASAEAALAVKTETTSRDSTGRHIVPYIEVMEVTQPAMVLANRQGVASLVCKYKHIGNAKEIRVTLLKQTGDRFTEICASTYTTEFKMFSVEEVIQCHVSPSRNNVTLTLTGLQANDTGLYVCKMERMYPPPYFMNKGNGTHLYVIDPEPCPDTAIYLWVLGATASGFFLYSVIISAILVGKAIKRRRCLTTGVYVKMPSEKLEKKVIPFHITVN